MVFQWFFCFAERLCQKRDQLLQTAILNLSYPLPCQPPRLGDVFERHGFADQFCACVHLLHCRGRPTLFQMENLPEEVRPAAPVLADLAGHAGHTLGKTKFVHPWVPASEM